MPVSKGLLGEAEYIEHYPSPPRPRFVQKENGTLTFWAQPIRGRAYVIGAYRPVIEVSGWAVACVLDQRTGEQVAQPAALNPRLAVSTVNVGNGLLRKVLIIFDTVNHASGPKRESFSGPKGGMVSKVGVMG
jgi:hypothetical protein